ncbi:putative toxin-antitoxin system toxin component, PIN family [Crocosphaera sp. UHCC 0190]|uniref:putative toxin-antitoxin system toxin component, PIN family n=1 Tax=Crocosphaera sp. UHCC 0190 TaxID=3110246 RepID=UPI002B206CB3|nr:putative toxin-antitoxin system toxin component, PIN family [Crocosphaera sp. UHCC 0190]MEA5512342.1 putative toxin-antitoxin system toxin component, PIN family [Crocosphaera sp. UHCC 0190]
MNPYQLVIDTNVILSGLLSRKGASYKLLRILNDKRWQINISTTLIFEYEQTLKRNSQKLGLTLQEINYVINEICSLANHRKIFYLWRPMATDPDDDFLIDLAIESQADFIISYNKKDLKAIEKFGILVLTPKQFLQLIGEIKS